MLSSDTPLLIVDDDTEFVSRLSLVLEPEGFSMTGATSVEAALALPSGYAPAAILLDVDLPGVNGIDALPALAERFGRRIYMLSAMSTAANRLRAIEGGADFFFSKPVDFAELRLILRNQLLRRTSGGWRLQKNGMTLRSPGGQIIVLSGTEYLILRSFDGKADLFASRKDLLQIAGRDGVSSKDRAIDLLITRLRRKCSDAGEALPIRSIRGQGYIFCGELEFSQT